MTHTTRITLIRHGETAWNAESRWQGQADIELNENGRAQAAEVAPALKLAGIQRIYTSHLSRAHETAQIINTVLNVPLSLEPRFSEIHVGEFQGKTGEEIRATHPEFYTLYHTDEEYFKMGFPGGETYYQVGERAAQALLEVIEKHAGEHVLVVTHGGTIRMMLNHLMGVTERPRLHNCYLSRISHCNGEWTLLGFAEPHHMVQW